MKKIFLYGTLLIVATFIFLGVTSPKTEHIERSITVNQPVENVFEYVRYYKNMNDWSPWAKIDPNAKHEIVGKDGFVGGMHKWESDHKQVGVGEQEIVAIAENEEIKSVLRFKEPFESSSKAFLKTMADGANTKVTWGFDTEYGFVESIFMRFIDMDAELGKSFEEGLSNLKTILEK